MNIIIPLGGIGERFLNSGYTKPKPLIKVLGKEIIFWLLDHLSPKESDNIYIPYNEYLDAFQFNEVVNSLYPNIKLVSLPPTNGPCETIKLCINHFNIKGKIILLDGDTWYKEDILNKIRQSNDNLTVYFNSTTPEPLFSYIELKENQIIDIKEKIKQKMTWNKRKRYGIYKNYSLVNKLRKENKTTEEFEIMLNNLSLEEVIGLKLELASKNSSFPFLTILFAEDWAAGTV